MIIVLAFFTGTCIYVVRMNAAKFSLKNGN